LYIFFGENSAYNLANIAEEGYSESVFTDAFIDGRTPGNDMMWNPTSQTFIQNPGQDFNTFNLFNTYGGAQQ